MNSTASGPAAQVLNHRTVLVRPLSGVPQATDFKTESAPAPEPGPGQFRVRHVYLSLDPYQRSAIAGRHLGATGPLGAGDMPAGEALGQIDQSRHPDFRVGEWVRHFGGWQQYALANGERVVRVDPARAPLSANLGVLGMPGLTAYASVARLANVQRGQVVLVSAALGPVGSMVGQLARERGATVVGIAGSDEKCALAVRELHFDGCVNYKVVDFRARLAAALPQGADLYHDNVGGQMLADAFSVLKNYGTVVLCGLIERYNDPARSKPLDLALPILKRAVIRGLVVNDFESARDEFYDFAAPLVAGGRIRYLEDRAQGIEAVGGHFARLMRGENVGKSLVVLGPEP